jgi:hypothetical protein
LFLRGEIEIKGPNEKSLDRGIFSLVFKICFKKNDIFGKGRLVWIKTTLIYLSLAKRPPRLGT